MIDAAEASGELKPGGTIVEPTSGNTGVGLALVAQQRGYKCIFVCPDKVSEDKQNVLRAYGAEVVVCPTAVPPDHPDSYYSVSNRLVEEIDGAWKPDQYSNPMGPVSHYETTGPEIWADTDGKVTHFVAGVGTGGTITGAGRYLKEVSDGSVRDHRCGSGGLGVLGRHGSALPRRGCRRRLLAVGLRPVGARRDHRRVRRRLLRHDARLAREEALLVGGSCGMAVVAAIKVAEQAGPDVARCRAAARWRTRLSCQRFSTMRGCPRTDSCGAGSTGRWNRPPSEMCCGASPVRCPTWSTRIHRRPCATRSESCASTGCPRCPSSAPSRR